jgi:hypothetical protein
MTTVQPTNSVSTEELTYCEVHPDRETALRCNKCGRLMCVECAVQTPVGYRCRQCVRQHEDKFYKATNTDDIKVFVITAVLMGIGGAIFSQLPLGLFLAIIAGVPVGGGISEVALRAIQRRRGRYSAYIGAAGAAIGGLIGGVLPVYLRYNSMMSQIAQQSGGRGGEVPNLGFDFFLQYAFSDIGLLAFVAIVAGVVYMRFKMKM